MSFFPRFLGLALLGLTASMALAQSPSAAHRHGAHGSAERPSHVQLGPRPFFLVDDMADGPLKRDLQRCAKRGDFTPRDFSIGHRGAAMQFPEHTLESYTAAARMGAGILECDVTFTKDKALVCRHAQNDLHTTTNILVTPLAAKCTQPFVPAVLDAEGNVVTPAKAECRTSDITLAEFKTLRGKMDAFNPAARTPEQYLGGFQSVLLPDPRGERVAELIRVPVVVPLPRLHPGPLFGCQPRPPLRGGLPRPRARSPVGGNARSHPRVTAVRYDRRV